LQNTAPGDLKPEENQLLLCGNEGYLSSPYEGEGVRKEKRGKEGGKRTSKTRKLLGKYNRRE